MKTALHFICLPILLLIIASTSLHAQDCILKDTTLKIDFGSAAGIQDFNLNKLSGYRRITDNCPNDGMYCFAASTSGCYSDHWYTLNEDHTPGDNDGRMLISNASMMPGLFFYATLAGLKPNTKYEVSLWVLNLCKPSNDCTSILPDLNIRLENPDQSGIDEFRTGPIMQTSAPVWKRFFSTFTTPANIHLINLKFANNNGGGCGNDFALDDITFRECHTPDPPPVVKAPPLIISAPVVKNPQVKQVVKEAPVLKKKNVTMTVIPPKETVTQPAQIKAATPVKISIPEPIRNRENLLIKKIEVEPGELTIELYDNGTIDGDTVSIYHNNELVISHAGLSEKPITIRLTVNKADPHHELTMVAENLGSIPPNTSLMVVTSKGKRDEVFISSTKQQNAKLIIELK